MSPQDHHTLLCEGLFKGMGRADAEEEARYVVRYLLSGEDLSDIPPRGRGRPETGSRCGRSGARRARRRSSAT